MTREQRFQALRETADELAGVYGELAEVSKAKRSAYRSAFLASTDKSFTSRDGFARMNAHDNDMEELDLKAQIQVLEMQYDLLKFQIEHNAEDV